MAEEVLHMAGMGPAPKPDGQRRRRNATVAMVQLPAEGRKGRAPAWPIPVSGEPDVAEAEAKLWAELWRLPQAVAWERQGYLREVALYVRHQVAAEFGSIDAAREARMRSDRLGLTPQAMLRLRWEVATDEVGERRTAAAPAGEQKKRRLMAVDPQAG